MASEAPAKVNTQRHLVSVWNPSYAKSAMEEHLSLLLQLSRRADDEKVADDDVYVWWGKVRSQNRQQPLAHAKDVRAMAAALEAAPEDTETQLYLTDYRSLYVADVLDIHEGDLSTEEHPHVPAYYRQNRLSCDFWFRVADIRRLVSDDTLAVIEELKALQNVHYHDRPVSIYGGMVDLPLLVTRPDGRRFAMRGSGTTPQAVGCGLSGTPTRAPASVPSSASFGRTY